MSEENTIQRLISATPEEDELQADPALRPRQFSEFIGQVKLKANLSIFLQAAKAEGLGSGAALSGTGRAVCGCSDGNSLFSSGPFG